MKKIFKIAKREFIVRLRSPLYLSLTLIVAVALFLVPVGLSMKFAEDVLTKVTVIIVDESEVFSDVFQKRIEAYKEKHVDSITPNIEFVRGNSESIENYLDEVRNQEKVALLHVEKTQISELKISIIGHNQNELGLVYPYVADLARKSAKLIALSNMGIPVSLQQIIENEVDVIRVDVSTSQTEEQLSLKLIISGIFNLIIFTSILLYAGMTFQGVLEEKSSRIIELLVSSARPFELISGKIIGIGALALTQIMFWLLPFLALTSFPLGQVSEALEAIAWSTLMYLILLFFLGFLFYSSLYGAAAASISRIEDSQVATTPLTILTMSGYVVALICSGEPTGDFSKVMSYVPFFTSMVMSVRVLVGEPSTWEMVLVPIQLAAFTIIVVWFSGRVYRGGVLNYGGRAKLLQLFRSTDIK